MVPGGLRNPPTGNCICGWGVLTLSGYSWLEPGNSCPQPTPQIVARRYEEKTQIKWYIKWYGCQWHRSQINSQHLGAKVTARAWERGSVPEMRPQGPGGSPSQLGFLSCVGPWNPLGLSLDVQETPCYRGSLQSLWTNMTSTSLPGSRSISQMCSSPLPFVTEVGTVCTTQESPFLRFTYQHPKVLPYFVSVG